MTDYKSLIEQSAALVRGSRHKTANLANLSALIFSEIDKVNWVGFYLVEGERLVLGPFQGKPACIEIELGKGVCGMAAERDETQLVPNVHLFAGHIACDAASNSEIVVPIHKEGAVIGVLDIDSPFKERFTEEDRAGLEALVRRIEKELYSLL